MSWLARIKKGPSNRLIRGMLALSAGTAGARLIAILCIPVLSRIYTPAEFGLLAIYTAALTILVPCVTLCLPTTIPLPKSTSAAVHLVLLCGWCVIVLSCVLSLILSSWGSYVFGVFSSSELMGYSWLLPIGVALVALNEVLTMWATRRKEFRTIARTLLFQSFAGNLTKVSLGLAGLKFTGLVVGQVLQQSAGTLSLAASFWQSFKSTAIRPRVMAAVVARALPVPGYRLPSQLLMLFSSQAPLLCSAALFGKEVTGHISLALFAIAVPTQLLGFSLGKVYFAEISALGKNKPVEIRIITIDVLRRLAVLSTPPTIALAILGPVVFRAILGESWAVSGEYARIFAIYIMTLFVSGPLVHVFSVFDRQDLYLRTNLIRASGVALVFFIAAHLSLTVKVTLVIYSSFMAIHYSLTMFRIIRLINSKI